MPNPYVIGLLCAILVALVYLGWCWYVSRQWRKPAGRRANLSTRVNEAWSDGAVPAPQEPPPVPWEPKAICPFCFCWFELTWRDGDYHKTCGSEACVESQKEIDARDLARKQALDWAHHNVDAVMKLRAKALKMAHKASPKITCEIKTGRR